MGFCFAGVPAEGTLLHCRCSDGSPPASHQALIGRASQIDGLRPRVGTVSAVPCALAAAPLGRRRLFQREGDGGRVGGGYGVGERGGGNHWIPLLTPLCVTRAQTKSL